MINAVNKLIDRLEIVAMVSLMSVATLVTIFQVIYRYGFNRSLFWGEEVVIYSIIYMSFIGASMGVKYGSHISVDVLKALMPLKYMKAFNIIVYLAGITFSLFLNYYGFSLFLNALERGQLTPALRIPIAWAYLPIGISGILMTLRYLHSIQETIQKPPLSYAESIAQDKEKLI